MRKAIIVLVLTLLSSPFKPAVAQSDILCATVIAIIGGDPSSPAATQMLDDIRSAWRNQNGKTMTEEEMALTMLACVASPPSTIRDVFVALPYQDETLVIGSSH